ncbi:hypothetical protein [Methylibium sp.]|uniref:phospholipase D-like domain-containing protein n=1 Tax=Methylibium sp. TaxID=2067992 RepID=UPI0025E1C640|nr:hypothetical protein [Methylibium sp.]
MNREPHPAGGSAQVRRLPMPRGVRARPFAPQAPRAAGSGIVVAPPRYALAHALTRSLGQPLVSGNRVELLRGGEPAWAALLEAIDRAREHINLESPAFITPALAASLAQRLITRAGAGVRVNLLLDGSRPGAARDATLLRQSGINVCASRWLARAQTLLGRAAGRHTQRSLIVVDGHVAFLGGLAPPRSPGAGSCLRVEGPAVAQLQDLFLAHWRQECGTAPPQARYFPALSPRGPQRTGLAVCSAGWHDRPLQPALLAAIDAAQHSVLIGGTPASSVAEALTRACARGIEVQVLLPATHARDADEPAERARNHALLCGGARLHRRRDAPLQADICVIDGVWAAVGCSLDFDRRLHGAELTLIVLDGDFGAGVDRLVRDDIARSCESTTPETEGAQAAPPQADAPAANAWRRGRQWLSERLDTRP